jgi:FkbH-like protein
MVLTWDDFSAVRVNWQDKASNLRELAEELNIGLDSMVFVDDNPVEIEMVRQNLPEVTCILFNKSPIENLERLQNSSFFENITITESDRNKGKQYKEQAQRHRFQKQFTDLTDFYRSLEMKAEIRTDDLFSVKRLAQLTQKTNQFNLTTRRYTEAEMEAFIQSDSCHVVSLRLQDRFGDNGITGLAIVKIENDVWHVDTFLLSCRIIGRTAETALLAHILEMAKAAGARRLIGEYIPTRKNALVKEMFRQHGFVFNQKHWELDVQTGSIEFPEWIERTE